MNWGDFRSDTHFASCSEETKSFSDARNSRSQAAYATGADPMSFDWNAATNPSGTQLPSTISWSPQARFKRLTLPDFIARHVCAPD
jgi:hypothetical protein